MALAGLGLAFLNYGNNQDNTEITQQAYVSLEKSELKLRHTLGLSWANHDNGERNWDLPEHVYLDVNVAVENVGSTPADIQTLTFTVSDLPANWTPKEGKMIGPRQVKFAFQVGTTIVQKATDTTLYQMIFTVEETTEERKQRAKDMEGPARRVEMVTVDAQVGYMTAFGAHRPVSRCWQVGTWRLGLAVPCYGHAILLESVHRYDLKQPAPADLGIDKGHQQPSCWGCDTH